jgi:fumarate hydratase class II
METVARICDRSPSAIYRGINPDDPLKLNWLTIEHILALGQALLGRGKPEFFTGALRQEMESRALADSAGFETLESPTLTLAEATELLSQALRLSASSLGRGDQGESMREERALMIVEALEAAIGYAKRAKIAVLRTAREHPASPRNMADAEATPELSRPVSPRAATRSRVLPDT